MKNMIYENYVCSYKSGFNDFLQLLVYELLILNYELRQGSTTWFMNYDFSHGSMNW